MFNRRFRNVNVGEEFIYMGIKVSKIDSHTEKFNAFAPKIGKFFIGGIEEVSDIVVEKEKEIQDEESDDFYGFSE